ncbi:Vomp family autotransporter [Bartonella birtlesii]|uniref:Vomp family autotransporter n=1 Tax=Bartonella birtlesii TaxID=111504 RepID=UPI00041CC97E|nr:Vomp family autotransporter [Bartonella birtlesii]
MSHVLERGDENAATITIGANTAHTKVSFINNKGEARIVLGVAAGDLSKDSTEAVNGSQLYQLTRGLAINTTGKDFTDAVADAENSVALGSKAIVGKSSVGGLAFGYGASVGKDANKTVLNGIALGTNAFVSGENGVALGAGARAENEFAFALGANASSTKGGVAIGANADSMVDSVAIGHKAKINGQGSIAIGANAIAKSVSSVVIGKNAQALDRDIVIGYEAYADKKSYDALVLGNSAKVAEGSERAVAIGSQAEVGANASNAMAIGYNAKASVTDSIALGGYSIANVKGGIAGYDPRTRKNSDKEDSTWVSTKGYGALSIGNSEKGKTRQIVNVAAGTKDTDAVNVAQLKALQDSTNPNWELSVNGKNKTNVNSTNPMDLAAESTNLTLTKSEKDNNIKFDLARDLVIDKVQTGNNTLDATGLVIGNGPKITTSGIDAGSKKITGVQAGADNTDAVNFGQLSEVKQEVQEQVAANSFIKQASDTRHITIGKETDGDKIDITNKDSSARTISGVKAGTAETDAVNFAQLKAIKEATVVKGLKINTTEKFFKDPIADGEDSIAIGNGASVGVSGAIAIGWNANTSSSWSIAFGKETKIDAKSEYSFAFGSGASVSKGSPSSFAFGYNAKVGEDAKSSFAIGTGASVSEGANSSFAIGANASTDDSYSFAFGSSAKVSVRDGIALGSNSIADVGGGVPGYDPRTRKNELKQDNTWLSSLGVFSIGDGKKGLTRQIVGVAAGAADTDAVNVAQLKALQDSTNPSWDLLVDGKNKTSVNSISPVDLVAGSGNLNINKGEDDNKVTFDLAKDLTLNSIKLGEESISGNEKASSYAAAGVVTLDRTGLIIKDGPQVTIFGINAGSKKITGVAEGIEETDAVNFSQLKTVEKDIKEQVAASSFVKQNAETQHITIGKETGGDKIDITNNKGDTRTLTGIKNAALSAESKEAVTGSQLFTTNQKVDTVSINLQTSAVNIAKFFGGSTKYENGAWSTPIFTLKTVKDDGSSEEKIYNNVTEALSGVSTSFTNVQRQITEQISNVINTMESENLVQQEQATNNITIGAKQEGSVINITNKNGEARTLLGVKTATKDNEAVNKGQLDTSIKDVNNEITNKFNDFTNNITNITQQVQGDALLWDKDEKAFVAFHGEGSAKTNSKITHLLDGAISSSSKDAITGSQLYSMGNAVSASLGGGASYERGSWIAPTFTVNKFDIKGNATQEDYKTVSDALLSLSTSLTNIHNEMNNEISHVKGMSLVKQDDKTKLITVGGEEDGTIINIANNDKEDRTLFGVKAAENANEAVNKAQLDKLDKKIESTNSFAVFYDKQSDDTVNYKSVTFGGKNKESVALHNVADGVLTKESHDAINGGQITTIFQQVVKYFGGSATFKEGIFTGPIYKLLSISENGTVGQTDHDNVVSAFEGLDTNIKNVNKRIKEVSQSVSGDSLLWDKNKEAFVALHGEGEIRTNSKITYLKDGDITVNSSDAVNGSQLYSLNEQLAIYFGGGAGYDKQGNWQAPNFKIKQFDENGGSEEKNYSNISDALSGVGNSFTNIQNKITHEISKIEIENLIKQEEKTRRITIGGEKDGSEISIANSASSVRSLSGVKAGLLTVESTEAVNGSQLYSVINVLSSYLSRDAGYKDEQWLTPNFKVAQFTADGVVSKKENYTNVASAFEGVNESMTNINNRIHDIEQSVFSGGLNWSETEKAFDARHKGQDSKIKHVADGKISENSKEAVNGSQLWQTNKKVEEVESHVNMIDKQVKDIASVADIAVKYDEGNDGKKKNKVTLVGVNESDPVLIDNIADGRIESGSKEAITGGQLHDYTDKQMKLILTDAKKYTDERFNDIVHNTVNNIVHESQLYTDIKFEALRYEIKEVRKESRQAAAIGLAVSNLSYEDSPGSLSLSIGTGIWRNQSAFAVGAGYISEDGRLRSNISATSSGGHWGIGAGLRVKLH